MKNLIKWTTTDPDDVRCDVRATVSRGHVKWQYLRRGAERWDYDRTPSALHWDELQDILRRRAARGRAAHLVEVVANLRAKAGV